MPETKELEVQLDGKGVSDLERLAGMQGIRPEELAAQIIHKELDRMTRTAKSRSNVRPFRKG
ncbi:hypothetical protein [Pseudomonas sp. MWU12-2345]|uniref:hypothetical protein n=1 Tax=Pseudomonas sp. MWU12-2345 TaxID=2928689 RepID=UPI00200F1617|nr:hypothetical protein [Pseudomonas sp. MWU12-2345]